MKYTFSLLVEGEEHGAREKRVLESRAGESERHIALKILSYLLLRPEAHPYPLEIEVGVNQRHRPDLVARDPEGVIHLWVDCGQIEPRRLARIATTNPSACILVVKSSDQEAQRYAVAAERFLRELPARAGNVEFIGFGTGFLTDFLDEMRGNNTLIFQASTDGFQCVLNDTPLETRVLRFGRDSGTP